MNVNSEMNCFRLLEESQLQNDSMSRRLFCKLEGDQSQDLFYSNLFDHNQSQFRHYLQPPRSNDLRLKFPSLHRTPLRDKNEDKSIQVVKKIKIPSGKLKLENRTELQRLLTKTSQDQVMETLTCSNEDVLYVNEKRYKRMMVRRIKRAIEEYSWDEQKKEILRKNMEIDLSESSKKYRYLSRHVHANKRVREDNGRFTKSKVAYSTVDPPGEQLSDGHSFMQEAL